MFSGIDSERFGRLARDEGRWLDNVKKAFFESDRLYTGGQPEDCMEPLCKAIDTAKTSRRSLRGKGHSTDGNARLFKEFIDLEVRTPGQGGVRVTLKDARFGSARDSSFSGLAYAIRCMVHENEHLSSAEAPDYHILLVWSEAPSYSPAMGLINNGSGNPSAHCMWRRLREVVAKFITGIDMMISLARGGQCHHFDPAAPRLRTPDHSPGVQPAPAVTSCGLR